MLVLSGAGIVMVDALLAPARAITLCELTGGLLGCASQPEPRKKPSFYENMATPDVTVDAKAAASMISGYRKNNGLGTVALDPKLMAMAETHARNMAARNKLEHSVGGQFSDRIKRSGFDAKVAVENIGAGYHTLAEAFSGWRKIARPSGQHAAPRDHQDGDCRDLRARLEIQGVLGPDHGRARRPPGIVPRSPEKPSFVAIFGHSRSAAERASAVPCLRPNRRAIRCEPANSVYSEQHYFRGSPNTMATQPAPAAPKAKQNTVSLKHLAAALASEP